MKTTVSCVIPCFNDATSLSIAVESCLQQGEEVEVIIVDDCSTDTSFQVAQEIAAASPGRVRVFRNMQNSGPAFTRNHGAFYARGALLCFLDSDDQYLQDFIRQCANPLMTQPNLAAVKALMEVVNPDGSKPLHMGDPRLKAASFSYPCNMVVRKEVFLVLGGFPTEVHYRGPLGGEDVAFAQTLTTLFHCLHIPYALVRHNNRPGSHLDKFLNRTRVENGKIIFTNHDPSFKEQEIFAATEDYFKQAQGKLSSLMCCSGEQHHRAALAGDPRNAEAPRLLTAVSTHKGALEDAMSFGSEAVAADGNAASQVALGQMLTAAGRHAQAIVELQGAVDANPSAAIAHLYLGDAYAGARSPAAAEDAYRAALKLWPDYPEAHVALGRLLLGEDRTDEAIATLETGTRLKPDNADALLSLARLYEQRSNFERAAQAWRALISLAPENPDVQKGLARAFLALGELPAALALVQRIAAAAPHDADAHYGMGNVLLRMQRPQESLASYRRALALVQTPKARFAEASPLLMLGDFAGGWGAYEARLGMRGVPWKIANVRERLWDGGAISRQRLLVHTEQGIGDTLQFIRYLPMLRERVGPDAHIAVLCEPELADVVASVGGFDSLHAPAMLGDFEYDVQVPLLSLPHRLGATPASIPSAIPYIRLPAGSTARIERARDTKLAIAFAWAGRPTHGDDRMRSCSVDRFAPLFELAGAQFFSIQVGPRAADIEPYLARPNVASVSGQLTNLAQTLAVIDQVDLVVAVDTSVVHLAGAYGKPVWTLLAFGGEWRWMLDREDTPWYPSMRLFRQRAPGDWDEVFQRVRARLETMIG
jgi:tetratricopeptide (TPR) repeat protein